ncbi:MAG: NAD-dependent epimerase/dehydratase family protein, partial [Candidatus Dormibacteraceae bacterium]
PPPVWGRVGGGMISLEGGARAEPGTVFLTGSTGFIGSYVLESLLAAGYTVRALVRDQPERLPEREGLTPINGDLVNCGDLIPSLRGCRYLVHLASVYTLPGRPQSLIQAVNVEGCAALLEAAHLAGVEKAVVTSSALTVDLAASEQPATESDCLIGPLPSGYLGSKVAQERISLASPLPCVLVLPTTAVGAGSLPPHPTSELLLRFLYPHRQRPLLGGINLVPVEDVASGHLRALERGWPGERYLLGGENLSFEELEIRLAEISHRRLPRIRFRRPQMIGAEPPQYVNSAKAASDLGWWPGPIDPALEKTIECYRSHGLI